MEEQDRRADIMRLVDTLRRATTAVQVLPFMYSAMYIVVLAIYNFTTESVQAILDSLFYVSPVTIFGFLLLSKVLRLCKWHKTACSIPLIPLFVNFVDSYVHTLSTWVVYVFNAMLIVMVVLLLIAAYNVFIK